MKNRESTVSNKNAELPFFLMVMYDLLSSSVKYVLEKKLKQYFE